MNKRTGRPPLPESYFLDLHAIMLQLQDEMKPFLPTLRDLKEHWNVSSTSQVRKHLDKLYQMDLLKVRMKNKYSQYFAIRKEGNNA